MFKLFFVWNTTSKYIYKSLAMWHQKNNFLGETCTIAYRFKKEHRFHFDLKGLRSGRDTR